MGKDKWWYKIVKIPYMRNFWGKKERELKEEERKMREERENERLGLEVPFYFSRWPRHAGGQGAMLEHGRVPNSSFCCPGSTLECEALRSSVGTYARAWLPGFIILIFLSLLFSNAPQVMILHTYLHYVNNFKT